MTINNKTFKVLHTHVKLIHTSIGSYMKTVAPYKYFVWKIPYDEDIPFDIKSENDYYIITVPSKYYKDKRLYIIDIYTKNNK